MLNVNSILFRNTCFTVVLETVPCIPPKEQFTARKTCSSRWDLGRKIGGYFYQKNTSFTLPKPVVFSIDCKAVLESIKPQSTSLSQQKSSKPALEGLLHQPVEVESGLQTKTLLLKITTALLHTNCLTYLAKYNYSDSELF